MVMKITRYCVYPGSEEFDETLVGERQVRKDGVYTRIYCKTEEEAKDLSDKILGSKFGAYYYLANSYPSDYKGPREY